MIIYIKNIAKYLCIYKKNRFQLAIPQTNPYDYIAFHHMDLVSIFLIYTSIFR